MEQAKYKANEIKQEASGMMYSQADKGSTQAGEKLHATAEDLHSVSETLHERGRDSTADIVDQAASQAERLASYLRNSSGEAILRDAQDYARRQPLLTVIGGVALGFLAARFVRASGQGEVSSSHPQQRRSDYQAGGYTQQMDDFSQQPRSPYTSAPAYEPVDPTLGRQGNLKVVPGEADRTEERSFDTESAKERSFETERTREMDRREMKGDYDTDVRESDEYGENLRDDLSDDLRRDDAGGGRSF
jgi:hypothetical protein